MPISSSSTPATSARRPRKRSIPSSAASASSRTRRRARAATSTIAVAGCVAQAEGEEIVRRAPAVDLVVGPQSYHRLPELLARAAGGARSSPPNFRPRTSSTIWPPPAPPRSAARGVTAFVTVQEGCDKFCTFCVVPYTRGAEMSRPVAKIVAEASALAAAGVREITLIGQNVNAYHGEGAGRAPAASPTCCIALAAVPGLAPAALHDQPSPRHGRRPHRRPSRPPHADAAASSAGAVGLRPHSRRHEPPPYARRLSRASSSGCARRGPTSPSRRISSSAFPARPRRTLPTRCAWSTRSAIAGAFSFKYSPRPGTPAAERGDQVDEAVKVDASRGCRQRSTASRHAFNRACAGQDASKSCSKSPAGCPARSSDGRPICSRCRSWRRHH